MVAVLLWTLPPYNVSMSFGQTAQLLLGGVSIGALTYLLIALGLWLVVGQPAGPERVLIDRARGLVARGSV
jgi:hypothetical protein